MKKLLLLLILISTSILGQKIDTIIKNDIYKSYFNYKLKQPVYVSYILYKGGGDCNRSKFRFKNDTKISMTKSSDYSKSGYDQGHLANSEDFANDCINDEKTFRFYNCLPQTPNLNRGVWKVWEDIIRNESQNDSLLIICGGKFGVKLMGTAGVPEHCFKIVRNLKINEITHVLWFTNKIKDNEVKEITIEQLWILLGYKIDDGL